MISFAKDYALGFAQLAILICILNIPVYPFEVFSLYDNSIKNNDSLLFFMLISFLLIIYYWMIARYKLYLVYFIYQNRAYRIVLAIYFYLIVYSFIIYYIIQLIAPTSAFDNFSEHVSHFDLTLEFIFNICELSVLLFIRLKTRQEIDRYGNPYRNISNVDIT